MLINEKKINRVFLLYILYEPQLHNILLRFILIYGSIFSL